MLRVVGRSLATAAEAAVGYHLSAIEPRARSANDWTRANVEMGRLARRLSVNLGSVFRHHVRQAVDFQRASFVDDADVGDVIQLAIGFVDLSGFTATSDQSDLQATKLRGIAEPVMIHSL